MSDAPLPAILCVDDEARVVQALGVHLRPRYHVLAALSGAQALERLSASSSVAAIVSDMRTPGMNGATLLASVRALYPDTIRISLSGEAGRDTVVSAVNRDRCSAS